MRDRRVIASLTLVITTVILVSIVSSAGAFSAVGSRVVPASIVSAAPATTTTTAATTSSVSTNVTRVSSPTVSPTATTMPTTVQQTLSSETVVPQARSPGNGIGHAYGLVKHESTTPVVMIVDQVTIASVQGPLPGTMDKVNFSASYNSVQYCSQTASFDPSGSTAYTIDFMCQYKGAGTYNFGVQVFDENQTLIGTSL